MKKVIHNISVRVIPFLVARLMKIWFFTCRRREHNNVALRTIESGNSPGIAIFWHYSITYIFYTLRKRSAAALVSASKDGDYIAHLAKNLNFTTVRGSKHRRGLSALKGLLSYLRKGTNVAIVADGSKGPPLIVQPGAILLASKTGAPILPIVWSASSYYAFRSWDRLVLPKLFSTIDFLYGDPFYVPPDLDPEGIEKHRKQLEEIMLGLYLKAWNIHNRNEH